ncbi:MAG TPA: hypothetical protein VFW24_08460 [Acidimicrobiales bacterium]|nr:hypothetical protein [Acidimicrobiales bacterium]
MSDAAEIFPTAQLNQVLSEVLDVVQDVKQAHRKVPEAGALHAELDRLFVDLKTWAELLVEEDRVLGVSPLSELPTAAGRVPVNLWAGSPTDADVRRVVGDHLDRLQVHLERATAAAPDPGATTVLMSIRAGLEPHLDAMRT